MMEIGATVDNRVVTDMFGVASMGGIRVNHRRSLIVLIRNNTDTTYSNVWRDGVLHFVGQGSVGPQKLNRQNKTLAESAKRGYTLHLFEVFERSKYVYAGEVELTDEPHMSDQQDARNESRFVWVFPLRRKPNVAASMTSASAPAGYLPHGAYAVIDADLTESQVALIHDAMDRLKNAGVKILDQRDIDQMRYDKALATWHQAVLDRVRSKVNLLIAYRKRLAASEGRKFQLIDDELRVNSASTENELRAALGLLDRDDPASVNQIFDEAMSWVPMPAPPKHLQETTNNELPEITSRANDEPWMGDRARFKDFT